MAIDEGAVTFVLEKLHDFITTHAELLRGVDEDVRGIKSELDCIRSCQRNAVDSVTEPWFKDISEEAYDIEDVLDEFAVYLQRRHGNAAAGYIPKLKNRYSVATGIKDIKNRLQGIARRMKSYATTNNHNNAANCPGPFGWEDRLPDYSSIHIRRDEIVGIEEEVQKLQIWLLDESSPTLQLASVVGMAGIGKTVLVKQAYDSEMVRAAFQHQAWIKVPRPWNFERLMKLIANEFLAPQGAGSMSFQRISETLQQFLSRKRYLLILDDVSDVEASMHILNALPSDRVGSRIVITTTLIRSSSNEDTYGRVFEVKPLQSPHTWNLFCKKAFLSNVAERSVSRELEDVAWAIVERCGGLPLAIVTAASLLKKKGTDIIEWKKVLTSLTSESASTSSDLSHAMSKLAVCYNGLPYHLQPCFMYLGIFPEGKSLKRMRLIRLWMAEGFIEENEYRTMEETAEGYLNELLDHRVIEVDEKSDYGREKSYNIHPLMLEFIVSKAKERNFFAFSTRRSATSTSKIRRLSISSGGNSSSHNSNLSHVRSCFAFGVDESAVKELFPKFKFLRALDLEGVPLENFPKPVTKLLFLRYLSLENTKISMLPDSVGELEDLLVLNLKGTFISELPVQIRKLTKLRNLLVYRYAPDKPHFDCMQAVKMPKGIGTLESLQKLSLVDANGYQSSIIGELRNLRQLRRLGIVGLRSTDGGSVCSSLQQMTHLRSFSVKSSHIHEFLDLHRLSSPPRYLQRLYLRGRLEVPPDWICKLEHLTRLTLGWSALREDPFQALHVLPALEELTLLEAYVGDSLYCGQGGKRRGFPNLKSLYLDGLDRLQIIQMEEGAMPRLQRLVISHCQNLWMVPLGIEHLTMLKEVELYRVSEELVAAIRTERQRGRRLDHIKRIYDNNANTYL